MFVERVSSEVIISQEEALEVLLMEATPSVPTTLQLPRPKESTTKEK